MRFSLKAMFAAVTGVAVICALLSSLPNGYSALAILLLQSLGLPAAITGAINSRGNGRAFCIGCISVAVPWSVTCLVLVCATVLFDGPEPFGYLSEESMVMRMRVHVIAYLALMTAAGLTGILVRRLSRA